MVGGLVGLPYGCQASHFGLASFADAAIAVSRGVGIALIQKKEPRFEVNLPGSALVFRPPACSVFSAFSQKPRAQGSLPQRLLEHYARVGKLVLNLFIA
jgi:hypothetical protein